MVSQSADYSPLGVPGKRRGSQPKQPKISRHAYHSFSRIALLAGVISIPLILFSTLLLVIVFNYRLQHIQSLTLSALEPEQGDSNVYYIRFNATKLLLLASVSSSAAPLLTSFFMSLLSYPVSSCILRLTEGQRLKQLPDPHQLGLLITALNGGPGALWDWTEYMFRKKRNKTVGVVEISFWGLATVNAFTYLSLICYN